MTLQEPITISQVNGATGGVCTSVNVAEVLAKIRGGEWQSHILHLRNVLTASGKDAAKTIKLALPAILWSGEFARPKNTAILNHSGLICADFDHVASPAALRDQIAADPHCVAAFISPSGDGVKALFVVDKTHEHLESWRAVDVYCKATFGLNIDPACKNVARLCFVSYDPGAFTATGDVACVPYPPTGDTIAAPSAPSAPNPHGLLSPGDDFNARGDVPALLRKHGWSSADDEVWTRPGKASGLSATLGKLDEHPRALFVFTSAPEAAPLEANHTYQPFAVFALLEHAGDFTAAAAALREQGFGKFCTEDTGPLYFDGRSYFRLERDGRYGQLGRSDAQLHLKMRGHSPRVANGLISSPLDQALYEIQRANRVTYAAPFCGRPAGLYEENGSAVLATDSPKILAAAEGDPSALENFFRNLFGEGQDEHADTQFTVFVGWLQRFRRALANPGQHLPGQALFLVGPADCGKTLAQTLTTNLAGGRSADPSGWIFKNSDFNDGLWGAEVLTLSDANVEDVSGARRKLRDRLKQLVANDLAPCHRKHRGEISLRPIWRVLVSANPDADSATVIPPLDESLVDKVIYLKCYPPPFPFHDGTEDGASNFFKGLMVSAPAFLSAVEGFEIPAELRGTRFGVKEWHHPAIVEMLTGIHPDADLADLIEAWISHPQRTDADLRGTASDLFGHLSAFHYPHFEKTCRSALLLGQALARLAKVAAWRERISSSLGHMKTRTWTLTKNPVPTASAA